MAWLPFNNGRGFGIAIHPYNNQENFHLNLAIGDFVIINEVYENQWYFGRQENGMVAGIFPCAFILPLTIEKEYPKVLQTLREWMMAMRSLYIQGDGGKKFEDLCELVNTLVQEEIRLSSGLHAEIAVREGKQYMTRLIDKGNMKLRLDLQLRNEDFTPIDPLEWYCVSLFNKHKDVASTMQHKKKEDLSSNETCCLVLELQDIHLPSHNYPMNTEFIVSCSLHAVGDRPKLFSEVALVTGTIGDIRDRVQRIVFTDLTRRTLDEENISLVIQIVRKGLMDHKKFLGQQTKGGGTIKRPVAVGRIRDLQKNKILEHQSVNVPLNSVSEQCLDDVVFQLLKYTEKTEKETTNASELYTAKIGLRLVKQSYKAILDDPSYRFCIIARRLVMVNDLNSSDLRNSVYIQLVSAEFCEKANKDKNIEVAVMLVGTQGEFLNIYPGGATDPQAEPERRYTTTVYHHKNTPRWGEMVKIDVPDDIKTSHLSFYFIHRSSNASDAKSRLIAFSFLPLQKSDGSVQRNGEHRLYVYKVTDAKKFNEFSVETHAYLQLPYSDEQTDVKHGHLPTYLSPSKDKFSVEMSLSSTVLTNNVHVFGILHSQERMLRTVDHLEALNNMLIADDAFEIFKFLPKLFDVFFEMACSQKYEKLHIRVFLSIIRIISHALSAQNQEKYPQYKLIIEQYLQSFRDVRVHETLVLLMTSHLKEFNDMVAPIPTEADEDLFCLLTSAEYLFMLIVRSKACDPMSNTTDRKFQFEANVNTFFNQFQTLLGAETNNCTPCSPKSLKEASNVFPKIINILIDNYSIPNLIKHIRGVLDAHVLRTSANLILKGRLMISLTSCTVLENKEFRSGVIPVIIGETQTIITNCVTTILSPSRNVGPIEVLETQQCTSALEVLQNIIHHLEVIADKKGGSKFVADDIDILVSPESGILRHVCQLCSVLETVFPNIPRRRFELMKTRPMAAAIVISLFQLMQDSHWSKLIACYTARTIATPDPIETRMSFIDLEDFTCELLDLIRSLCSFNVFSFTTDWGSTWTDLLLLQSCVCLKVMSLLHRQILSIYFYEPINTPVLLRFFNAVIEFTSQPHLQWNRFTVWQSERYLERGLSLTPADDWRRHITDLMVHVWRDLEPNRLLFIPERVNPFMIMSFVKESYVREAAITMIFDMMVAEDGSRPKSQQMKQKQFCPRMTESVMASIDRNLESLDQQYRADFERIMNASCNNHRRFHNIAARMLIADFVEQLQLLIEYNTFICDENADNRKMAIFSLLKFYEKIERDVMYVRYLDKLTSMNLKSRDFTEAANTLLLMTKHLRWTNEVLGRNLEFPMYPHFTTHASLKEHLCLRIIELFVKDCLWELAIEQAEELVMYYRDIKVDYDKASDMLKNIAQYYKEIVDNERNVIEPSYYIIQFYGDGLPTFITDKSFIYRGRFGKKLYDILQMLEAQFPLARSITKKPDPENRNQYFRVTAVEAVPSPPSHWGKKKIPKNTMWFYRFNATNTFELMTPKRQSNDLTHLWLDVKTITTQDGFPSVLRMVPIVSEKLMEKNPLESASITMQKKTEELRDLYLQPHVQQSRIESIVQGILMAHVSGGYKNYEGFFSDELGRESWVTSELITQLCVDIQNQLEIVQMALVVLDGHTKNRPLFEELKKSLVENVAYIKSEFGCEVTILDSRSLAVE